jgi:hypothetical protein
MLSSRININRTIKIIVVSVSISVLVPLAAVLPRAVLVARESSVLLSGCAIMTTAGSHVIQLK